MRVRSWSWATWGLALISPASSLTLPPPTGPYNTGIRPYVLNHNTINDPVAPNGTGTSVLAYIYYPTFESAPPRKYIDQGLGDYYESYFSLPSGAFYNITAPLGPSAPYLPESDVPQLPTLLFGPPFAGPSSQCFTSLFTDLVSHGYTVITLDHPYEQPFLEYPDGTGYPGLPVDFNGTFEFYEAVQDYRLTDTQALLSALPSISEELAAPINLTHFVLFGHSLGGSAALNQPIFARNSTPAYGSSPTFLGAMNLDGSIFGAAAENSSSVDLHIPTLLMAFAFHENDPGWQVFESEQSKWVKELRVLGTNHTDFSDLILWKQWWGISEPGEGVIAAQRMVNVTREFVRAFVRLVNGGDEGVLSGSQEVREAYPEVVWENDRGGGL